MKTTKEPIRRRRRQRNLTTSWKLATCSHARERGKEKDVTKCRKRRKRVDGGREKLREAKKRTKTRNEGRGNRLGGRTTAATDLLAFPIIIPRVRQGRGGRLVLGTEGKVNPIASRKRGDLPIDDESILRTRAHFVAELRVFDDTSHQSMIYFTGKEMRFRKQTRSLFLNIIWVMWVRENSV